MTSRSIRSLFIISLAIAFSPLSRAQDVGMLGQVSVPFAFATATGQHFQAGVYRIRMVNSHTLMIQGRAGGGLALANAVDDGKPAKTGRATFHKYGNEYYLDAITVAGKSRRLFLQPSRLEKQQQIAGMQPVPVEVALGQLH